MTTSKQEPVLVMSSAEWKKQLITKEDPTVVHKILGLLCLVSIVFRLSHWGVSDMAFVTHPHLTVPTILLHLLLNVSSFIFTIPKKRIVTGYRIWPQYRLHNMVFSCRAFAMMTLIYVENAFNLSPNPLGNLGITMATLLAADISSFSQGKYQSNTVRDFPGPVLLKVFFSYALITSHSITLLGMRRYTLHFYMLTILQLNSFFQTLRRKNLASQSFGVVFYTIMLALGLPMIVFEFQQLDHPMAYVGALAVISNLAVMLRLGPRLPLLKHIQDNKYLLWGILYMILERIIRPLLVQPTKEIVFAFFLTFVPLGGMFLWMHYKEYHEVDKKAVKVL